MTISPLPQLVLVKRKSGVQLNLKKAELKNVTFIKKDAWLGEDMRIRVGALNLDANNLGLTGNRFEINSLQLINPEVALYSYSKLKPATAKRTSTPSTDTTAAWNEARTVFKMELNITNGSFSSDRQTERAALAHFDGIHIHFTGINANLNNSTFTGDTVFSKLQISAKERSGLEIKNLSGYENDPAGNDI